MGYMLPSDGGYHVLGGPVTEVPRMLGLLICGEHGLCKQLRRRSLSYDSKRGASIRKAYDDCYK